jgi:hypothetical protein
MIARLVVVDVDGDPRGVEEGKWTCGREVTTTGGGVDTLNTRIGGGEDGFLRGRCEEDDDDDSLTTADDDVT